MTTQDTLFARINWTIEAQNAFSSTLSGPERKKAIARGKWIAGQVCELYDFVTCKFSMFATVHAMVKQHKRTRAALDACLRVHGHAPMCADQGMLHAVFVAQPLITITNNILSVLAGAVISMFDHPRLCTSARAADAAVAPAEMHAYQELAAKCEEGAMRSDVLKGFLEAYSRGDAPAGVAQTCAAIVTLAPLATWCSSAGLPCYAVAMITSGNIVCVDESAYAIQANVGNDIPHHLYTLMTVDAPVVSGDEDAPGIGYHSTIRAVARLRATCAACMSTISA